MESIILDDIPYEANLDELITRLRIEPASSDANDLRRLVEDAEAIARPKALYRVVLISDVDEAGVVVEGIRFTSRVLRVNLEHAQCVFPFTATCGSELDAWSHSFDDVLYRYWAEEIKQMALGEARVALDAHLNEHYHPGLTARMNPGSLKDWPLSQQRPLFALLGDPESAIGVQLTTSYLMIPNKSVSGIRFPTREPFESCQLCPREGCPGRRAPHDGGLYDRKYRLPGE